MICTKLLEWCSELHFMPPFCKGTFYSSQIELFPRAKMSLLLVPLFSPSSFFGAKWGGMSTACGSSQAMEHTAVPRSHSHDSGKSLTTRTPGSSSLSSLSVSYFLFQYPVLTLCPQVIFLPSLESDPRRHPTLMMITTRANIYGVLLRYWALV